jgi:Ca2+-binding RTX toxin-like protein
LNPSVSFAENVVNVAPQLLDANVVFSATGSLAGARLVVSGLLAEDRMSVLHQGGGAGEVGVSGSTISYGGVVIGNANGGVGSNFTITFNSAVTAAAVDAVIERLAYGNVSNAPTATRTLIVNVIDSSGASVNAPLTPQFVELAGSANPFNGIDVGSSSAPSFTDLDGDGDLDLVMGEAYGSLLTYRRDDAGRYTELAGIANPFNGINVGFRSISSFADLDGDGDFDLVIGESGGTLRAWRNTGAGFSPLTGAANPFNGLDVGRDSAPCFVDFDGDGDIDRLVGEWYGNINIWRNNGVTFTELTGDTNPFKGWLGGDSVSVTFIDLDGDGDLDPIVGGSNGWLRPYQNVLGNYQFWPTASNPFASIDVGSASRPIAVDLDSDGDQDLVVGNYDGTLRVWQNTTSRASISVTVSREDDGPPTIISGNNTSFRENQTGIVYQALAGGPDANSDIVWSIGGTDSALFSIDSSSGALRFISAPDFERPLDNNNDNIYHITVSADDSINLSLSKSVIIAIEDVREPSQLTGLNSIAAFGENTVNRLPQLLDASVSFSQGFSLANSRLVVSGLLAEDRVSILGQGNAAGQIGVSGTTIAYSGTAIGSFSGGYGQTLTITFNSAVTGAAVDALIERLAYANVSDDPTLTRTFAVNVIDSSGVMLNAPLTPHFSELTGNANPLKDIRNQNSYSSPTFTDLDGDGDLDIVMGRQWAYYGLLAWRNDGSSFSALTQTQNPFRDVRVDYMATPVFADLDGDSDLDLIVGGENGTLNVWRKDSAGYTALSGSANPFVGIDVGDDSEPSFGDIDGDSDLDLVVGSNWNNLRVWVKEDLGYRELVSNENPLRGVFFSHGSPTFADIDADGDSDIIVGSYSGDFLVFRNDGFVFSALTANSNPFRGISIGWNSSPSFIDLDGDNRLDLVSGNLSGTLNVFRNTTTLPSITVTVMAEDEPTAGHDIINASPLDDTVDGLAGDDRIDGLAGNDSLLGMSGNDTLTGGAGADTLMGGAGNDLFIISDTLDIIIETAGGGADTIITSVSMTMPNHIEALRIATDVSGVTLTGGAGNDMLIGNGLSNTFNGGAGDDVILAGNVTLADIYALFAT